MSTITPKKRFDFVGKQKPFILLSLALVIGSLALIGIRGLNFGVDFRGGSEIILDFKQSVTTDEVRGAAAEIFEKPDVQSFGEDGTYQFLIRVPSSSLLDEESTSKLEKDVAAQVGPIKRFSWTEESGDTVYIRFQDGTIDQAKLQGVVDAANLGKFTVELKGTKDRPEYMLQLQELQGRLADAMATKFGADKFDKTSGVLRAETVGPRVGKQLQESGIASILLSMLFILIYIAFRFDIRYAPGAVIALLHDVIITIGVYALFQVEVSLPIIAALLTIVGYSLNDTIVVFDRIRENFALLKERDIGQVVNISINDSLSRTLLTSITTLLAVLALYTFAGDLVRQFALALIIGVVVGTYSSTFVASPVLIAMHKWVESRKPNTPPTPDGEDVEDAEYVGV